MPIAVLVGLLVAVLILGAGAVLYSGRVHRAHQTPPATTAPSGGPSEPVWTGKVEAVRPASVTASCASPDATDSRGKKVSYAVANVLDGRADTAWRCDGDGVGQSIELTFDQPVEIAEVSLINGYAKTDPNTNESLYPQYRRLIVVDVELDGQSVEAHLRDDRGPQRLRIPPTTTTHVRLRIVSSTPPGRPDETRDAVLVSEISLARPER